jgi:hypothetical protein
MFIRNRLALIYELLNKTNPTICLSAFSVSSIHVFVSNEFILDSAIFLILQKLAHNVANLTGPGFYTNVGEPNRVHTLCDPLL